MVRVYLSGSNTRADFDDGRKLSFCPKQTRLSVDITGVFSLTDNILKVSERLGKYADIEGLNGQTFTDVESCLLYLESVVNPPKGAIYEDFNTSSFTAKIGYRHNVAILDQRDLNVDYPLGAVDGDRFFIVPLVNLELDSVIVGGEYIIESKNKEITTFTFNGTSWIPAGGDVATYQERVKIRMSGAGLMDFSVSGATGVKWVMYSGEVYTQNSEVPSGDINQPQIVLNEAGWVKLYVDDWSSVSMLNDNNTNNLCISSLFDFRECYKITLSRAFNITGDLNDVSFFDYFLTDTSLITGDLSDISFSSNFVYIRILSKLITGNLSDINNPNDYFFNNLYLRSSLITGDLSSVNISCYNIDLSECTNLTITSSVDGISFVNASFRNCNFSQSEIYNLIKYNYDLNNTNKTLNITNNSIPDATTLAMITEMTKNRGWVITHD